MAWPARKQLALKIEPLLGLSRPAGGWGRPGRPSGVTTAVGTAGKTISKCGVAANPRPQLVRTAAASALNPGKTASAESRYVRVVPAALTASPATTFVSSRAVKAPSASPATTYVSSRTVKAAAAAPASSRGGPIRSASGAVASSSSKAASSSPATASAAASPAAANKARSVRVVSTPATATTSPSAAAAAVSRAGPTRLNPASMRRAISAAASAASASSAASKTTPAAATSTTSAASCSPSPPSYDDLQLPLVLDPKRPNSEAMLLKAPQHPWDSAVWLMIGRNDEELLVVKQTPYHTLPRASLARRVLYSRGNHKAADFTYEVGARKESATLVQLPGIFVQPLLVRDREYSREAEGDETCPDREVLTVIPYYPCGDAGKYLAHVATPLIAALADGKRSVAAVVEELVEIVTRLSRAMFELVSQVHKKGFLLIDHKLENMVYDHVQSRWQLIDAEEVHQCSKFSGENRHTPAYAAPEQMLKKGMWVEPRSDVFACGRCIERAINDCRGRLKAALGEGSEALADATKAFNEALEPLLKVVAKCTLPTPAGRPVAADALRRLREQ